MKPHNQKSKGCAARLIELIDCANRGHPPETESPHDEEIDETLDQFLAKQPAFENRAMRHAIEKANQQKQHRHTREIQNLATTTLQWDARKHLNDEL